MMAYLDMKFYKVERAFYWVETVFLQIKAFRKFCVLSVKRFKIG
jgi:hypothetical protein